MGKQKKIILYRFLFSARIRFILFFCLLFFILYQIFIDRSFIKQTYKYVRGYSHYFFQIYYINNFVSKKNINEVQIDEAYTNKIIISKAGGIVDKKYALNSVEGINASLHNPNCHFIEVDFHLTKDNYLVLKHDWEDYDSPQSLKKFLSNSRSDGFTNIDFIGLEKYLDDTNHIKKFITDIKLDNVEILKNYILKSRHKLKFIPQVFNFSDYVFASPHFNKIIFSNYLYEYPPELLKKIDELKGIFAITISEDYYLFHKDQIDNLLFNSKLLIHPIKSITSYNKYYDVFDGFYSYSCDMDF